MKGIFMKLTAFIFFFSLIGISAQAQEKEETPPPSTTQADWFSPACPTCAKLLTPGRASLGNNVGVFSPHDKTKVKKKKSSTTGTPVEQER